MATHGHGMNHVVKLYFKAKHTLVQKCEKVNYIKNVYKYVGEDQGAREKATSRDLLEPS